jgi:hypothetical protein
VAGSGHRPEDKAIGSRLPAAAREPEPQQAPAHE